MMPNMVHSLGSQKGHACEIKATQGERLSGLRNLQPATAERRFRCSGLFRAGYWPSKTRATSSAALDL